MTIEKALERLKEMQHVVKVSYNEKKWVRIDHVSDVVDIEVLKVLEDHNMVELRVGFTKYSTFRIKLAGLKAVIK